ncbi:MAG: hypothetical protein UR51_C0022G0025 [Candidatus Moranbacteria bacterium GW2011_GWF1_34_10]|nr:MAG: hypothetical protein UR51_C0022G0025 [Candidatus Moranbacteria bacterium GW2011_GWF1_34_10]
MLVEYCFFSVVLALSINLKWMKLISASFLNRKYYGYTKYRNYCSRGSWKDYDY